MGRRHRHRCEPRVDYNIGAARYPRKLYRSRDGRIFGVCRGLAEYLEISVRAVRILTIIAAFMTGFTPVCVAYVVLAVLMKPAPVLPLETEEDAEFYNSYTGSREMAVQRIKRLYESLDRRIQRMEAIVTARDYDWERRLDEGRE